MTTLPIPFSPMNKSADKPIMSVFNQDQRDGYWMEYLSPDGPKMIWAKRPGLTLFKDLGQSFGIDGMHYWGRQQRLFAATSSKMFKVDSGGTETDVTGTTVVASSTRPIFADVLGTHLYSASNGQISQFPASGSGAHLSDPQAPTTVSFIATLNQVLVGLNYLSDRFDWADAGTPTVWSGLYASVEGQPDLALALHAANGYLYFHGQSSLEAWRDDGDSFVREQQGVLQRGTLAAYSVSNINGAFYWLDNTREICRLNGFTIDVISNPALSRYLKSFDTVTDARGDYLKIEGRHFYVLSFPTEGKTLVYDIGLNMWYEWGYWNSGTAEYEAWKGSCVADATDWNKTLVGDRSASKIYEMGGTTDAGDTIRTVITTDAIDRKQPEVEKFCHELTLHFKRADTATTPKSMVIKYRDNGSTDWSTERTEAIEAPSKTDLIVRVRRLGKYRSRVWQFIMSDATQSALFNATETFDYGR